MNEDILKEMEAERLRNEKLQRVLFVVGIKLPITIVGVKEQPTYQGFYIYRN